MPVARFFVDKPSFIVQDDDTICYIERFFDEDGDECKWDYAQFFTYNDGKKWRLEDVDNWDMTNGPS